MKQDIGINQRIPISLLEMALLATLDGEASSAYFAQLAATEYKGENRIKKAVSVINRLTVKNPLLPFLKERKDEVKVSLRNNQDRALVFASIICSAYSFAYESVCILGKYLHIQDAVSTALLRQKLSEKYGANRSLPNAMNCVLPMLIEAGLLSRPVPGTVYAVSHAKSSEFASTVYGQAYLLNNLHLSEVIETENNPFFEFIR